jgi:uncharacterized membrane protein
MKKTLSVVLCFVLCALGVILAFCFHGGATAEAASGANKVLFAMSVILAVGMLAAGVANLLPQKKATDVRNLAMAAIFAALCYVGCTYFKIPIPGSTSFFHFGNTFCVLGALFLGGFWGGMAGSIGMTISDLFNGYVDSAPRTFILKLCIGLIAGFVAHKIFRIADNKRDRKLPLPVATVISCVAGMAFNVVADPLLSYLYKMYIMGIPQDVASSLAKIATVATAVNAVVAVIAATVFYLALRPALTRAKLMPKL